MRTRNVILKPRYDGADLATNVGDGPMSVSL